MSKALIIAEKPSVAADIARALGIEGLRALPTDPWVVTPPIGRQA